MPKKTHVQRLDFEEAKAMFGEEILRSEARSPQSLSNWKALGVPADVILPLLMQKVGLSPGPKGVVRDEKAHYKDDAAALVAIELRRHPADLQWVKGLLSILRHGGERRRLGIESNIEAFLGDMESRQDRETG